jgi:hypothetical protein
MGIHSADSPVIAISSRNSESGLGASG